MKSSSSDLKGVVLVINFETLAPKCCYRDNDIYDIVLGKDVVSVGDYADDWSSRWED